MATEEPTPQPTSDAHEEKKREEHKREEEHRRRESTFYFKKFWLSLKEFIRRRLSIIDNATPDSTIEGIEKDAEFRGFNLWILILSILICSIGLNVNSTAVVIGAMLISPLMGPIMGIGLSLGINDIDLLKRSLRNWGVAVAMAILSSTTYFFITPLNFESSELLARTTPTLLDVLVAIFGGAAGILAGSRREKNNVVPGVAIATALMPPLCTAGFGLATGKFDYFFGAIYLFLINSIFIALATTLVVRYLKYPVRKLPNLDKERKVKRAVGIIVFIFVLPSMYVFYNLVTDALYDQRVQLFRDGELHYEGAELVRESLEHSEEGSEYTVVFFGEEIPENVITGWKRKLNEYELPDLDLRIVQGVNGVNNNNDIERVADVFMSSQQSIEQQQRTIEQLRSELIIARNSGIPNSLVNEITDLYPEISQVLVGQIVQSNTGTDTICTVYLKFNPEADVSDEVSAELRERLSRWLETRRVSDSVWVRELP